MNRGVRSAECGARSAEWNGWSGLTSAAKTTALTPALSPKERGNRSPSFGIGEPAVVQGFKARMLRGILTLNRGMRRTALRLDPPDSLKRTANVRRETRRTAPETGALPGNIERRSFEANQRRRARSDRPSRGYGPTGAPYQGSGVQCANYTGNSLPSQQMGGDRKGSWGRDLGDNNF